MRKDAIKENLRTESSSEGRAGTSHPKGRDASPLPRSLASRDCRLRTGRAGPGSAGDREPTQTVFRVKSRNAGPCG